LYGTGICTRLYWEVRNKGGKCGTGICMGLYWEVRNKGGKCGREVDESWLIDML